MTGSPARRGTAALIAWWLSVVWATQAPRALEPAAAAQSRPAPAGDAAALKATVDTYCVTCHNDRLKTGGLGLDGLSSPTCRRTPTSGRR